MPLPPAPTKRAALLSSIVLEAPTRAPLVAEPKKTRRTTAAKQPLTLAGNGNGNTDTSLLGDGQLLDDGLVPVHRQPPTPPPRAPIPRKQAFYP